MRVEALTAAEEIQLLLPENQADAGAGFGGGMALMLAAALLLLAVPFGWSRAGANRRMADAGTPATASIDRRA